jgi:hypothetical protein
LFASLPSSPFHSYRTPFPFKLPLLPLLSLLLLPARAVTHGTFGYSPNLARLTDCFPPVLFIAF